METTNQTQKKNIETALKGSRLSFSAEAKFTQETEEVLKGSNIDIKAYESGALEENAIDYQTLLDRFQKHPIKVQETGGIPIKMKLQAYPIFAPEGDYSLLYRLAVQKWDLLTGKREIEYILEHPRQFLMQNMSAWQQRLTELDGDLDQLIAEVDAAKDKCLTMPDTCELPAGFSLAKLRAQFPPRFQSTCGRQLAELSKGFAMSVYPLHHVGGDSEMEGHSPSIRLDSLITVKTVPEKGQELQVTVNASMLESKSDWTHFLGEGTQKVLDIDQKFPGCSLTEEGILDPVGSLQAKAGKDDHNWHTYAAPSDCRPAGTPEGKCEPANTTGHIKTAHCRSDTKGSETGRIGCDRITFDDVVIDLIHDEEKIDETVMVASALQAFAGEEQADMEKAQQKQADWQHLASTLQAILGEEEFSKLFGGFSPVFVMSHDRPTTDMVQWNFDGEGNPLPSDTFDLTTQETSDGEAAIRAKWASLGGDTGSLGSPTEDIRPAVDGVGLVGLFQGGVIYWHPDTGAHEVHGAIYAKWAALGWENAVVSAYGWTIGYPIADELPTADEIGRVSHFQGASIYWHPDIGAYFVGGAIRQLWWDLGAEQSPLSYPISDEESTGNGIERVNGFMGGWVYWDESRGAYEVYR